MARLWLETVGYADTIGRDSDDPASRWPYRDWVAASFNENLPYDQFLTAQLAGDLLEGAAGAPLATAFNRLHPVNQRIKALNGNRRVIARPLAVCRFGMEELAHAF